MFRGLRITFWDRFLDFVLWVSKLSFYFQFILPMGGPGFCSSNQRTWDQNVFFIRPIIFYDLPNLPSSDITIIMSFVVVAVGVAVVMVFLSVCSLDVWSTVYELTLRYRGFDGFCCKCVSERNTLVQISSRSIDALLELSHAQFMFDKLIE